MKLPLIALSLALISLAACAPKSEEAATETAAPTVTTLANDVNGQAEATTIPHDLPKLAYDYMYRFAAPKTGIEALIDADQAACSAAGMQQCMMVSLASQSYNDDQKFNKTLEIRVTPTWLKTYQSGLKERLKGHDARITEETVTSDDLSIQLIDTQAQIKNKEALRDQLQERVRNYRGNNQGLYELQTQLSNLQSEIDAARSSQLAMQKRVEMVHVTLSYQSNAIAGSDNSMAPLAEAFRTSLGRMANVMAFLVSVLSYLLPLGLIAAPVIWFVSRQYGLGHRNRSQLDKA